MLILDTSTRHQVTRVTFDPTGTRVAGECGKGICIWETATGSFSRIPLDSHSLAFHPRAPWLYAATNNDLVAYNTDTEKKRLLKLNHLSWANNEYVGCVAMDPAGRWLLSHHAERGGSADRIFAG